MHLIKLELSRHREAMNTCSCSTDEDISNIPKRDIAISTVICKLADVNDVIVT